MVDTHCRGGLRGERGNPRGMRAIGMSDDTSGSPHFKHVEVTKLEELIADVITGKANREAGGAHLVNRHNTPRARRALGCRPPLEPGVDEGQTDGVDSRFRSLFQGLL